MAQHFLQSKAAKTLSLAQVFRMTELEAETTFRRIRWNETDGAPICPDCGGLEPYEFRRPTSLLRFRCKACSKNFSITSGTLFASHKAPLRAYLAAIAVFMNEVKGKNALALSRDLGMSHKACWILLHKVREAMTEEFRGRKVGGEGKVAEVDGAYFGGHVRPANFKENRRDRRLVMNQSGKRQSVIIVRERNGHSLPAVFRSESAALSWIKSRVLPGTIVNADEASGWNDLQSKYEMKRINHQEAYSDGEACTNQAESYFSRLRRGELGYFHHVSGPYLLRYAVEASFREDARRVDNGTQVRRVTELALKRGPSIDFSGYYQRHIRAAA
ncbi:MAG TPA: IS1595 family transposase [Rhizomicrobium sp.]|nr:IS1595 family transposase [Rhizomicrobium sp.]